MLFMTFYVFCLLNEVVVFCFCSTHLGPQSLHKCSRILGSVGRGLKEKDLALLGERLCLAGLFGFWAVLSMWLYSWLLSRAFLT